jgi:cyclopropane fatty-acyl-phospholipid synthase-like methyltransferase
MTKLQSIVAEIKTLSVEEQREVISQLEYLTPSTQDEYIFTDEEWAEIDDVLKNDTGSFTVEEVFNELREKYAADTTAK